MKEVWKDIEGYEGVYQVSTFGNVIRLDRFMSGEPGLMSALDNGNGYKYASLSTPRKGRKNIYIHRLVAKAFIPNPENKKEVNHKDAIKGNNRVSNLEWVTLAENRNHASKKGLLKLSVSHYQKLKSAGVRALSKPVINIETGVVFESLIAAAKSVGLHRVSFQRRMRKGTEPRFKYLPRHKKFLSNKKVA